MSTISTAARQPVLFLSHGGGPSFFLKASEVGPGMAPFMKGIDKDSKAAKHLQTLSEIVSLCIHSSYYIDLPFFSLVRTKCTFNWQLPDSC